MTLKVGESMSGNTKQRWQGLLAVALACGFILVGQTVRAAEIEITVDTPLVLDDVTGTFTILASSRAEQIIIDSSFITVTVADTDSFSLKSNDRHYLVNDRGLPDCSPSSEPTLVITGPATVTITPEPGPCVPRSRGSQYETFFLHTEEADEEIPQAEDENNSGVEDESEDEDTLIPPLVAEAPPSSSYNRRDLLNSTESIDEILGFSGLAHAACPAGDLLRGSLSSVYYCGNDGYRHTFPQENVYRSWFGQDFSNVRQVSDDLLATIPLGSNMTYRPGLRLLKIQSDSRVYAISGKTLRWIENEAVAEKMYGASWNEYIDDIADPFFTDYDLGLSVTVDDVVE